MNFHKTNHKAGRLNFGIAFCILLFCLVAFGVLCRGGIFWIFLNTSWSYTAMVVATVVLVILPRVLFSYFVSRNRPASLSNVDINGVSAFLRDGVHASASSKYRDYKWYLITGLTIMAGPVTLPLIASDWTMLFVMFAFVLCCSLTFAIFASRNPRGARVIFISGFGFICISLIGLVTLKFGDWRQAFDAPALWYRFSLLVCCFSLGILVFYTALAESLPGNTERNGTDDG